MLTASDKDSFARKISGDILGKDIFDIECDNTGVAILVINDGITILF